MNCANHPDVTALGVCRECGKALCSLCVYFQDGQMVCAQHAGAGSGALGRVEGPPPAPASAPGGDAPPTAPLPPVGQPFTGTPVAPPAATGALPGPVNTVDPRLEPLPMALRPGWPDEPAQPPPSSLAENLGLVALILGIVGLPFSICCGFGGVIGIPVALVAGGLGITALVKAPGTRNPNQARWTGGIGVALGALDLIISLCYLVAIVGLTQTTAQINTTILLTAVATP